MPTQCSADLFGFAPVEGRRVEAGFDGGTITSDAGALLLGATDRVVGLVGRLAGCFVDARRPDLIEHDVATLIGQRVFGIALGYEDLNDHEHLRHDPAMAVLAGKLVARRSDCAPVAGKSTLNRLELSRPEPTRYHKIAHDEAAIERLFVELFLEAHANPPKQIVLDLDATDDPVHGHQEGRFFHGLLLSTSHSNSHSVAARSGCTIPACGGGSGTDHSSAVQASRGRFVHPGSPGLIRSRDAIG